MKTVFDAVDSITLTPTAYSARKLFSSLASVHPHLPCSRRVPPWSHRGTTGDRVFPLVTSCPAQRGSSQPANCQLVVLLPVQHRETKVPNHRSAEPDRQTYRPRSCGPDDLADMGPRLRSSSTYYASPRELLQWRSLQSLHMVRLCFGLGQEEDIGRRLCLWFVNGHTGPW